MAPVISDENIYDLPKTVPEGENIYNLATRLDRPESKGSLYGLDLKANKRRHLVSNERIIKQRNLSTLEKKDYDSSLPPLLKYQDKHHPERNFQSIEPTNSNLIERQKRFKRISSKVSLD